MGEVLQIRVVAQTYDPAQVQKRWANLVKVGWADGVPEDEHRAGVLDLVDALTGRLSMGMLDGGVVDAIGEGVGKAAGLRRSLDAALADWNAKEANELSVKIEDLLDALENQLKKS